MADCIDMKADGKPSGQATSAGDLYEKRKTIYMRSVSGKFNNARWIMVLLT